MSRSCFAAITALAAGLATVLGAAPSARADEWHVGLDLRADPGTHPIRVGGGIELGRFDSLVVLDPMFWTDGQHDIDLLTLWQVSDRGLGLIAGARTTAIGIQDGHQLQHKLVLGVGGPIPIVGHPLRMRWAFELATVLVKHGAGLPSETISFESGRDFIDLVNFGMFVTFEYAGRL